MSYLALNNINLLNTIKYKVCDVSVERPRVSIVSVEDRPILNQGRTYLFIGFSVYNQNYSPLSF